MYVPETENTVYIAVKTKAYTKPQPKPKQKTIETQKPTTNGPHTSHLTKSSGIFNGPSGKETYYNLNMNGVVNIMRCQGYNATKYPYWVRNDGVKMLGDYVMVAANLTLRPRGTILESSLGTAIVCDTGGFAKNNQRQLDIATSW